MTSTSYSPPPVPNELYGDSGFHCFKSAWFESCIPNTVGLQNIHRQTEPDLIKCINECATGLVSDGTINFILLARPLSDDAVQLFARNIDADVFNYRKLNSLPGEMTHYDAVDEGSKHHLNKFLAPKHIRLKVGCPVILLKNLSDKLINGLQGTVI